MTHDPALLDMPGSLSVVDGRRLRRFVAQRLVKGRVTVNDQPLQEGQISFVPVEPGAPARPQEAPIVERRLPDRIRPRGRWAGEYQVQINAFRKTGKKIWDGMGDEKAPAAKKNYVEEIDAFIPAKYNTSTELRPKIKSGVNLHNFDLKVGGKS